MEPRWSVVAHSPKPPLSFRHLAGEETRRRLTHVHYLHRQHSVEAQPESDGRSEATVDTDGRTEAAAGRGGTSKGGTRRGKTEMVQTPEPEVSKSCPSMRRTNSGSSQEGRHILSEQRLPQVEPRGSAGKTLDLSSVK